MASICLKNARDFYIFLSDDNFEDCSKEKQNNFAQIDNVQNVQKTRKKDVREMEKMKVKDKSVTQDERKKNWGFLSIEKKNEI